MKLPAFITKYSNIYALQPGQFVCELGEDEDDETAYVAMPHGVCQVLKDKRMVHFGCGCFNFSMKFKGKNKKRDTAYR
ncbi:hypothetical protein ACFLRF_04865 [Candidatus Altiarchaeota archaeon]